MTPRRVVAVVPDLFFAARIMATARHAGAVVRMAEPAAALAACRAAPPDLVIVDLHAAGDPLALVRALKADAATAAVPVVGFYSHVDTALRDAATAAGTDHVLPRSAFTVKLPELLGA